MGKIILLLATILTLAGCGNSTSLNGTIGGSQESFEEVHGTNQSDDSTLYHYSSESGVRAAFVEDLALYINVSLNGATLEDAVGAVEQFLPEDAELVEERGAIYVYNSEDLREAVDNENSESIDASEEIQRFTVVLETLDDDRYNTAVIRAAALEQDPEEDPE
jgi:hypothetical protein